MAELPKHQLITEAFSMFSDGKSAIDIDPKLGCQVIHHFFDRSGMNPTDGFTVTRGDFMYVVRYRGRKTWEELDMERHSTRGGPEIWRRARIELGYDNGSLDWANFQHYQRMFVEGKGRMVAIFTNDQPAVDGNRLVIADFRSGTGLAPEYPK